MKTCRICGISSAHCPINSCGGCADCTGYDERRDAIYNNGAKATAKEATK